MLSFFQSLNTYINRKTIILTELTLMFIFEKSSPDHFELEEWIVNSDSYFNFVSKGNEPALRFWQKHGFQKVNSIINY